MSTTVPTPRAETGLEIPAAHRRMLETMREFLVGFGSASRPPDRDALRGAVAFLRSGVLAVARGEERRLAGSGDRLDAAATDHAFLAVETEALARELERLPDSGPDEAGRAASHARIRRLGHRIEAALELHALRDEEVGWSPRDVRLGGSACRRT